VERDQFYNLLCNYTSLTRDEAEQLEALTKGFPYSQVIHNLAARAAQDNGLPSKDKLLHTSAIYSSDRAALKAVMTARPKARTEYKAAIAGAETLVSISSEETTEQLRQELYHDLASLKESKRLFELTIERLENERAKPLPDRKKEEPEPIPNKKKDEPEPIVDVPAMDTLIEEIKSTKKKIKPAGAKQKEQIEIIDQFIKTQPTISRPKTNSPIPDNDLTEPSTHFGENIVSETLVEILLKQGKKEKAIEALKKLIWKFPQKKAYFAAQIEDLRK